MELQLGQVLSQMMETMKGMQLQQAQLQQALQSSDKTVGGITLQPYDEQNESFSSYLQRLQNYITLKGVTNATVKVQIFLNCIGPKHYQIIKNITAPEAPEKKSIDVLIKLLQKHRTRTGEVALQHKFCLRQQQEGESIANYVAGLKGIGDQRQLDLVYELPTHGNEEEVYEIQKINHGNNMQNEKFNITLQINGKFHTLELDTGAAVTTCSAEYFKNNFGNLKLTKTSVKLRTYTGEILQPLGTCNVNIKYRDSQGRVFIIDRKVDPVIGREWIRKLNIQFDINSIHKEENDITEKEFKEKLHKLLEQYRELFTEEIGEINNFQATYRLKAGTSPIFLKPRPVPLALRDQVENEIDRLEKEGILEKVAYSQWGTPVVPVIKQNGKVRLCADYRATLNKNIEDDNYPIPRIEEIFLS
ncbi:Uncharacterized protein K02A2.6 [Eumeta japonica]|uniref:Uncharacterized protein K02A2.6 n=1 Tax=Eumeta variegata TaxID=151549 RepID=A0A4C1WLK4_EUMVA|nr:Uncharacterized protein K02A2.6 [Eumeta japonica]